MHKKLKVISFQNLHELSRYFKKYKFKQQQNNTCGCKLFIKKCCCFFGNFVIQKNFPLKLDFNFIQNLLQKHENENVFLFLKMSHSKKSFDTQKEIFC